MARSSAPEPVTAVTDLASAWLPARLERVEERLAELIDGWGSELSGDAGETLAAGGKRMRPLLVLLSAGPAGGVEAIRAATAIELVHMATLVHDDVLDAAPMRRGRPTVAASSGRERAVATGDLLFSRAFAELSDLGGGNSRRQVSLLARASVALARGELAQREDAFDLEVDVKRYMHRCRLKTAALFECACMIGLERKPEQQAALEAFGRQIGVAFQLLDDVLDVVGPPDRTGKARGTDLLDGTVTLPLILARGRDTALAELDLRELDGEDAAGEVCDRIAATGSPEEVRSEARARVAEAKEALRRSRLALPQLELLDLVADGVVERYS